MRCKRSDLCPAPSAVNRETAVKAVCDKLLGLLTADTSLVERVVSRARELDATGEDEAGGRVTALEATSTALKNKVDDLAEPAGEGEEEDRAALQGPRAGRTGRARPGAGRTRSGTWADWEAIRLSAEECGRRDPTWPRARRRGKRPARGRRRLPGRIRIPAHGRRPGVGARRAAVWEEADHRPWRVPPRSAPATRGRRPRERTPALTWKYGSGRRRGSISWPSGCTNLLTNVVRATARPRRRSWRRGTP